ncbi:MAG: hypothetical protein C4532_15565 [Candidatus Abyssobacteria bacterium SURF_17]|jgi:hypothetical protein|uniref:Glycosyltransferase RgtA/B/C/D-like domain-containing protein n=1 Tax=Candidatus Abyssobacteria bacterium SURF_17 TaxID=2093361 RepID=A0A419ESX4_9BACT|nr:MAG: hypothetical protein C4532_15565 [Candidatus Abyssubacteria bacterium SURF_17]
MKELTRYCVYGLALLLIALPAAIALAFIGVFGVNVLYADDWALVPLVQKSYSATLTFADLFRGHNEHRIVFPRIITLVLAHLTHYDTVALMLASWTLAFLVLVMIFGSYRRQHGMAASAMVKFIPIAWMIFSLRQYEGLLWAFEVQIYLCVAGFVGSLYLMGKKSAWMFLWAVCCALISTFSFSVGLLTWPIGLLFMLRSPTGGRSAKAVIWVVVAVAVTILYLYDLRVVSDTSRLSFALRNPLMALTFLVMSIGSPLAFVKGSAIGFGAALSVLAIISLVLTFRSRDRENTMWMAFILFALGSSLFFMVGRVHYGLWAALASRYVPFTLLGVVGIYGAILSRYEQAQEPIAKQRFAILYGAAVSAMFIGIVCGYASGIARGKEITEMRQSMASLLIHYRDATDESLEPILFDVSKVREGAEILEKNQLNVFYANTIR